MSEITLRDYQNAALAAVDEALERGIRRQLLVLPTGGGKTVVFSSLIRKRGGTALILAHRDELLSQAGEKLVSVAPELGLSIGYVKAARNQVTAPIVIASVQTLAHRRRREQLPDHFDTVIIDEAHHTGAITYDWILEHIGGSPLILGVTATPERHDKQPLVDPENPARYEELVYARGIEEMIREGHLVDVKGVRVELDGLDLDAIKQSAGDFQAEDLAAALDDADAASEILTAFTDHAADRPTIVFCPTVRSAHEQAAEFTSAGVTAEALDGGTPGPERREIITRLNTGETQVVCNVGVLTEGFDEPSVSCIIMVAPTKSRVRYTQAIGRGLRLHPGKTDCLVIDLIGVSRRLTLQSLPGLFGLEKPPEQDEAVTDALDRERLAREELAQRQNRKRREVKLRSESVNFFRRDQLHWVHIGARWVMSLDDSEMLVLDPIDDKHWRVIVMAQHSYRPLARRMDLGYAQGTAEEFIRHRKVGQLVNKDAPWRREGVSEGQRSKLRHLGVTAEPTNRGHAADLITEAIAVERLRRFDNRNRDARRAVAA